MIPHKLTHKQLIDHFKQIIPKLNYSREFINNIISTCNYTIIKKKDDLADTLLYQLYILVSLNISIINYLIYILFFPRV
jgi:hypothetical protein